MIAFGDLFQAKIATLGINPSHREFLADGELLTGHKRRLATFDSLGTQGLDCLTDAQVETVVAECISYFDRNPYRQWFDPLDRLLRRAPGASYYDRSACHLDLVQWATDPTWAKIPDPAIQRMLLEDGEPHLEAQLASGKIGLVLLNGRSVLDQVQELRLADLEEVDRLPLGQTSCSLYAGTGRDILWIGWSTNLQSSWGVSNEFRDQLADWLAGACAPTKAPPSASPPPRLSESEAGVPAQDLGLDGEGYLSKGLRVRGRAELIELLREWLAHSRAPTIGDVGSFGGRAWVLIDLGGEEVVLNADTKRSAVKTVVRESTSDPNRSWQVVANQRGRFNKVIPGGDPLPGWYAYLRSPRTEAGLI